MYTYIHSHIICHIVQNIKHQEDLQKHFELHSLPFHNKRPLYKHNNTFVPHNNSRQILNLENKVFNKTVKVLHKDTY